MRWNGELLRLREWSNDGRRVNQIRFRVGLPLVGGTKEGWSIERVWVDEESVWGNGLCERVDWRPTVDLGDTVVSVEGGTVAFEQATLFGVRVSCVGAQVWPDMQFEVRA